MKSKSRGHSLMIGAGLDVENKENMNRENVDDAQEINDQQMYEEYSPEADNMNRDDDEYDQEMENNYDPMDQGY